MDPTTPLLAVDADDLTVSPAETRRAASFDTALIPSDAFHGNELNSDEAKQLQAAAHNTSQVGKAVAAIDGANSGASGST